MENWQRFNCRKCGHVNAIDLSSKLKIHPCLRCGTLFNKVPAELSHVLLNPTTPTSTEKTISETPSVARSERGNGLVLFFLILLISALGIIVGEVSKNSRDSSKIQVATTTKAAPPKIVAPAPTPAPIRVSERPAYGRKKSELETNVSTFTDSILSNPDNPGPYMGRARTYEELGRKEEAAADYQKVLALGTVKQETFDLALFRLRQLLPAEEYRKVAAKASDWVETDEPAPGCPERLPTYRGASAVCTRLLEASSCNSKNSLCEWNTTAKCTPRIGAYVPAPELSPDAAARLGIRHYDYLDATAVSVSDGRSKTDILFADAAANREKGQFNKAIADYSKILQSEANAPYVLFERALTYEMKGDKPSAVRDYCKMLVLRPSRAQRTVARERLAQLTGQGTVTNVVVRGETGNAYPSYIQPLVPPRTSTIESGRGRNKIAPLSIESEPGQNYLIMLVNVANERDRSTIYVKGGEKYSTKMAPGTYVIRSASGTVWYGKKYYFGTSTRFIRLRSKDGNQQTFAFRQEGNMVYGMTLSLKKVAHGNMEEETISREEFER